jgi:hypothetical protein
MPVSMSLRKQLFGVCDMPVIFLKTIRPSLLPLQCPTHLPFDRHLAQPIPAMGSLSMSKLKPVLVSI